MGRATRRGPWLPEEDTRLLQLVHLQGPNNWVRISQHMEHRSPKQCRERYHQNLKPNLNHAPITNSEGEQIELLVQEMGKRWAEIARRLGNRSDNAVKNWWNGSMNRRKRAPTSLKVVGPRTLPLPAHLPLPSERRYQSNRDHTTSAAPKVYGSPVEPRFTGFHIDMPRPTYGLSHPSGALTLGCINQETNRPPADNSLSSLPRPSLADAAAVSPPLTAPILSHPARSGAFPQYPPQPHSTLHPPHLHSRASSNPEWHPSRPADNTIASPGYSEQPPTAIHQRPPSLVSDHLSQYSISPRTVSSPRPTTLAPIDTSTTNWNSESRRNSYATYAQQGKPPPDEGYVSALPQSAAKDSRTESFPLDPSLRQPLPQPGHVIASPDGIRQQSPTTKDTRMNLANLLG